MSVKDLQKLPRSFRNIKCATHNLAHKIVTFVIWFQRCEVLSESLKCVVNRVYLSPVFWGTKGLLRGSLPSPFPFGPGSSIPCPLLSGLLSLLNLTRPPKAASCTGPNAQKGLINSLTASLVSCVFCCCFNRESTLPFGFRSHRTGLTSQPCLRPLLFFNLLDHG